MTALSLTRLQWRAFSTIVRREITRVMRIWQQTLLPPAITMSLYFLIFGRVVGSRIGAMGHVDYMSFIAPGLMMLAMITNSYANLASSVFTEKFQHSIEELLMSPIRHLWIVVGFVLGGVFRGMLVGSIVFGVATYFTHLQLNEVPWMLMVAFLTCVFFSLAGFINAILARRFDDITAIPTFALTPLIYLGGVFYSLEQLSPLWRHLSDFNPIVYLVCAFRHFMLNTPYASAHAVCWSLLGGCVIMTLIALALLKRRLGNL